MSENKEFSGPKTFGELMRDVALAAPARKMEMAKRAANAAASALFTECQREIRSAAEDGEFKTSIVVGPPDDYHSHEKSIPFKQVIDGIVELLAKESVKASMTAWLDNPRKFKMYLDWSGE